MYKIKIYTKTAPEQVCFTTPEATESINMYLEMKKEHEELLIYFNISKNLTMTFRQIAIRAGATEGNTERFRVLDGSN